MFGSFTEVLERIREMQSHPKIDPVRWGHLNEVIEAVQDMEREAQWGREQARIEHEANRNFDPDARPY